MWPLADVWKWRGGDTPIGGCLYETRENECMFFMVRIVETENLVLTKPTTA